ncbi:MAG: carbon storage regulator CsrA [Actinomycetota bacterium]
MLVLTRRAKQSVMIGDDIVVTVLEVRGDQVRLGIEAPRSVAVHREEVFEQVRSESGARVGEPTPVAPASPEPGLSSAAGSRRGPPARHHA